MLFVMPQHINTTMDIKTYQPKKLRATPKNKKSSASVEQCAGQDAEMQDLTGGDKQDSDADKKNEVKLRSRAAYVNRCQTSQNPAAYMRHDVFLERIRPLPSGDFLASLWLGRKVITDKPRPLTSKEKEMQAYDKHGEDWYETDSEDEDTPGHAEEKLQSRSKGKRKALVADDSMDVDEPRPISKKAAPGGTPKKPKVAIVEEYQPRREGLRPRTRVVRS
jgi:hypothetical protein